MTKKPDAIEAYDALSMALSKAKGIVRVSADAAHSHDEKDMHHALEVAFDLLDEAQEAARQVWDAREKGATP
jgi:hypothetical protein